MKSIAALALLATAFVTWQSPATLKWTYGEYDPAAWKPSVGNVLFGASCEGVNIESWDIGVDGHKNDFANLTDGFIPANTNGSFTGSIVGANKGEFWVRVPDAYVGMDLKSLTVRSFWSGGEHDGMKIKYINTRNSGKGGTKDIAGSGLPGGAITCGTTGYEANSDEKCGGNNSSGSLFISLVDDAGGSVCTLDSYLIVILTSGQDNGGTGFVEIEANIDVPYAEGFDCTYSTMGVTTTDGTTFECTHPAEFRFTAPHLCSVSGEDSLVQVAENESYFVCPKPGETKTLKIFTGPDPSTVDEKYAFAYVTSGPFVSGSASVTGTVNVVRIGTGSASCDLKVKYSNFLSSLTGEAVLAQGVTSDGNVNFTISNLAPGGSYTGQLYTENDAGEVAVGDPFVFAIPGSIGATAPQYVGLWSRRVSDSWNDGGKDDWKDTVMNVGVGSGKFDRHREIGMMSAYADHDGSWDILEPVATFNWQGNGVCTICNTGYMWFDAGVVYKFKANNGRGHTSYVLIDPNVGGDVARTFVESEMVLQSGDQGSAEAQFVTDRSGWHAVRLAKGRTYGYDHDNDNVWDSTPDDGFLFSSDGGANWKKIIDPGDGSFLRVNCAEMLSMTRIDRFGDALSGLVDADALIGGYELYACFSKTFGGSDLSAWTTKTSLGTVPSGGDDAIEFSLDVPDDVRYFRIAAVGNDGQTVCWTRTVLISELFQLSAETPVADFLECAAEGEIDFSVKVDVINPGLNPTCSIVVVLDADGDNPDVTNEFAGVSAGISSHVLYGLALGRHYRATVFPKSGEHVGDTAGTFEFTTGVNTDARLPGLWQVKINDGTGNMNWGVDVMGTAIGTGTFERTRQLGPTAALHGDRNGKSWENPFDPGTTSSWTVSDTFGYEGFIYLTTGKYDFNWNVDDGCWLKIDGVEVGKNSDNKEKTVSYNSTYTGWHAIHLEIADGSGSYGANNGEASIRYRFNGGSYMPFADLGDGSLFQCGDYPEIGVTVVSVSGGTLTATLSEPLASGESAVLALNGKEIAANVSGTTLTASCASAGTYGIARVFVRKADSVTKASPMFDINPDGLPKLSAVATIDGQEGVAVTCSYDVLSFGESASGTVKVYISESDDFADAELADTRAVSAVGRYSARISSCDGAALVPGNPYRIWVELTAADGKQDVIPCQDATPAAGSVLSPVTYTTASEFWDVCFHGAILTPGANSTYVWLQTGADENSLTNTAFALVGEDGSISMNVSFPFCGCDMAYRFVISNDCPNTEYVWVTPGPVATTRLGQPAEFYWKSSVTEGNWSDPANWTDKSGNALDPRCGYPNATETNVKFDNCSISDPVTIWLDRVVSVKTIGVSDSDKSTVAVDVTLRAVADTDAEIKARGSADAFTFAANSKIVVDGVKVDSSQYFRPKANSTVRFINGADVSFEHETWLTDVVQVSVESGSFFRQTGWRFEMWAPNLTFVLDDSTLVANDPLRILQKDSSVTNILRFVGTQPVLVCANVNSGIDCSSEFDSDSPKGEFQFCVPEGGYAEPVVQARGAGGDSDKAFGINSKRKLVFSVAKDSPGLKTGRINSLIMEWKKGIKTDIVELAYGPKAGRSTLYYTYGWENDHTTKRIAPETDGELPTGIHVRIPAVGHVIRIR